MYKRLCYMGFMLYISPVLNYLLFSNPKMCVMVFFYWRVSFDIPIADFFSNSSKGMYNILSDMHKDLMHVLNKTRL